MADIIREKAREVAKMIKDMEHPESFLYGFLESADIFTGRELSKYWTQRKAEKLGEVEETLKENG